MIYSIDCYREVFLQRPEDIREFAASK